MSVQFIACGATDCPMNVQRQCRSPFVNVDQNGVCLIRTAGSNAGKSGRETYVDLKECLCKGCRFWEKDDATELGSCGFRADLVFNAKGICEEYANRVTEPGFIAVLKDN